MFVSYSWRTNNHFMWYAHQQPIYHLWDQSIQWTWSVMVWNLGPKHSTVMYALQNYCKIVIYCTCKPNWYGIMQHRVSARYYGHELSPCGQWKTFKTALFSCHVGQPFCTQWNKKWPPKDFQGAGFQESVMCFWEHECTTNAMMQYPVADGLLILCQDLIMDRMLVNPATFNCSVLEWFAVWHVFFLQWNLWSSAWTWEHENQYCKTN